VIVSHSRKFVFLKSTKVAGSTVQSILALICGPRDIITQSSRDREIPELQSVVAGNYRVPFTWAPKIVLGSVLNGHGLPRFREHETAKRVHKLMPARLWNSYTKIVVMRNPFDRMVSWYFWDKKSGAASGRPFKEYLLEKQKLITSFRRQTHVDAEEIVDVYIRFENLENDLIELGERLGIDALAPGLANSLRLKGGHRPLGATTTDMFADFPEGVELISKLCAPEIQKFQYGVGHG
jgi:hypothetical protein